MSFNFFFLLFNGTWLREDQTPAIPIRCELELVVLMRNAFDPKTQLPRASTQEAKDPEGARPLKKAKTNGSDHRLSILGEAVVAKPFHW